MKFIFPLLLALAVMTLRAEDPSNEATRVYAAAQTEIERAVADADTLIVEAVTGPTTRRPVWRSAQKADFEGLLHAFRIEPPRIERRVVDGKEETVIRETSCFCYGQLWLTFKKEKAVLLSLLIKHGSKVVGEKLGAYDIEALPLKEFYDRMIALVKKTANKAPEPTPMSVTPPAAQEPRQP